MYPEEIVAPMRSELTDLGFVELRTPEAVGDFFDNQSAGTALLVVNSVCGCAAGNARPAVREALANSAQKPTQLFTVFAGQDTEATAKAREYLADYPPSSPCIILLKDGDVAAMLGREMIEGRTALEISADLAGFFAEYC